MKETLINEIYEAFSDTHPPNKNEMTACDCWECLDLREKFSKADEKTIFDQVVENQPEALSLLSEKAFHHFFKYYLVASLKDMDSEAFGATIIRLSPNDKKSTKYLKEKMQHFSKKQLDIIEKFIDVVETIYVDRPDYDIYDENFTIARNTMKYFITIVPLI